MSQHREWDDKILCQLDRECLLKSEHNATVRAYRDAMAECERLGKANDEACDRISELEREAEMQRLAHGRDLWKDLVFGVEVFGDRDNIEFINLRIKDLGEWNKSTLDENNRLDRELDEARSDISNAVKNAMDRLTDALWKDKTATEAVWLLSLAVSELESRPALTREECRAKWAELHGRKGPSILGDIAKFLDWLHERLPAPTDSIRAPFSDAQIEAMARVMRDSYIGHGHPPIPASGYWLGIARAAVDFMRTGSPVAGSGPTRAEAEAKWKELAGREDGYAVLIDWLLPQLPEGEAKPAEFKTVTGFEMLWNQALAEVATPDVLEQLVVIGWKARSDAAFCEGGTIDAGNLAQVTAILRAAQAYVDVGAIHMMKVYRDNLNDGPHKLVNMVDAMKAVLADLNSRIRYRVALPETPKGLPSARDLTLMIRECANKANCPYSGVSGSADLLAPELLAALRPWLREPTGWELDVTWQELDECWDETRGDSDDAFRAILDLCRSRIRPTFECGECDSLRTCMFGYIENIESNLGSARKMLGADPTRAALEGE